MAAAFGSGRTDWQGGDQVSDRDRANRCTAVVGGSLPGRGRAALVPMVKSGVALRLPLARSSDRVATLQMGCWPRHDPEFLSRLSPRAWRALREEQGRGQVGNPGRRAVTPRSHL